MTRPRSRFETVIQGFLDNMQRGNENVQRRFEAQDERDFTREQQEAARSFSREQYNTARADAVTDRDWNRTNELTDRSAALVDEYKKGFSVVMPFLIGTPDFEDAQALMEAISQPHGLTGQAALDWATNLTIDVGGRKVNLAGSLAKWQADADIRMRSEDIGTSLLAEWLPQVGNTALSDGARDGYLMAIMNSPLLDDVAKQSALDARGIMNQEERDAYLRGERRDIAATEQAEATAAMVAIDAEFHRAFVEGDIDAMQDAAAARKDQMGQSDLQAFWETGYLPKDNAALRWLAQRVAGGNMVMLRSMASANSNRYGKVMDANARITMSGADLAETQALAANWEYNRAVDQADLKDAMAISTQAQAAMLAGDVGTLLMLKNLSETGAYGDVMGHMDFDAWIDTARDIHQTGSATREQVRRAAFVEGQADIDAYVRGIAASFTLDDLELGMDGEWVGLDEAIEAELDRLSGAELQALGMTREQLRSRLLNESNRALNQFRLSEAQQKLAALEAAIPEEGDTLRRNAWKASYAQNLELLGFTEEEADALTEGLLSAQNRIEGTWRAQNTRLWQEVDKLYQETVGIYLDNVKSDYALKLMLEGGATMDIDQFKSLQAMYNDIAQRAQDMVNSPACTVPGTEAMWVAGTTQVPSSFQPKEPGCQQALEDANSAIFAMREIAAQARFGPDGMVILGGTGQTGEERLQPGGAMDAPFIEAPRIAEVFADHGHDPAAFNQRAYLQLDARGQEAAAGSIVAGATPEEVNAVIADILFDAAVVDGYTIPSSTAPTMEEAGLTVERTRGSGPMAPTITVPVTNLAEWVVLPIEERIAAVAGTREWESAVAAVTNAGTFVDEMDDVAVGDFGRQFGLWSEEAVMAAGLQPGGGVSNATPTDAVRMAMRRGTPGGYQPHDPSDWDAQGGVDTGAIMRDAMQLGEMSRAQAQRIQASDNMHRTVFNQRPQGETVGVDYWGNVDIEATREALAATVAVQRQRGAQWLIDRTNNDRTVAQMRQEAQERQQQGTPNDIAAVVEASGGMRLPDTTVPTPATESGRGTTGNYGSVNTPAAPVTGVAASTAPADPDSTYTPGSSANYDPNREPTAPGQRTPLDQLNIPPGREGTLFERYYSEAEAVMPALVGVESNGKHRNADGSLYTNPTSGAAGLTQVLASTAKGPGFGVQPIQNDSEEEYLRFGRDYLAALIAYFRGNVDYAIAAYHGGAGHIDTAVAAATAAGDLGNWLDYLPPEEEMAHREATRKYLLDVLAGMGRSL